jgi:hypothetical protein
MFSLKTDTKLTDISFEENMETLMLKQVVYIVTIAF